MEGCASLWNVTLSEQPSFLSCGALGESLEKLTFNLGVKLEGLVGGLSNDVSGDVINGGAQPPTGDDSIRALQGLLDRIFEALGVVSNGLMPVAIDAYFHLYYL